MIEIKARSRWRNIYSGDYVTVDRCYYGIVYYTKDIGNVTIESSRMLNDFMKPEQVFLKTYKPITF